MTADTLDTDLLSSGKKRSAAENQEPAPVPKPRLRRLLKAAAYGLIFSSSLVFFTYLKLPTSIVQNLVLNALNRSGAVQATAERVTSPLLPLPHLRFEKLRISPVGTSSFPPFTLDTARVFPSLLSLIPWTGKFSPSVSFDGRAYQADFSGSVQPAQPAFELTFSNLDFTKLAPLTEAGIDVRGLLSADVDLALNNNRLSQANGEISAQGKNLVLDPASFRLPMPLPILDLGLLDLKAKVTNGKIRLDTFRVGSPGKDLEVNLSGEMILADNPMLSRLELRLRLRPSPKILQAIPSLQMMLGNIAAAQPDGFYAMRISGALNAMGLPQPDR